MNIGPKECVELLITHNDALSNFLELWYAGALWEGLVVKTHGADFQRFCEVLPSCLLLLLNPGW